MIVRVELPSTGSGVLGATRPVRDGRGGVQPALRVPLRNHPVRHRIRSKLQGFASLAHQGVNSGHALTLDFASGYKSASIPSIDRGSHVSVSVASRLRSQASSLPRSPDDECMVAPRARTHHQDPHRRLRPHQRPRFRPAGIESLADEHAERANCSPAAIARRAWTIPTRRRPTGICSNSGHRASATITACSQVI